MEKVVSVPLERPVIQFKSVEVNRASWRGRTRVHVLAKHELRNEEHNAEAGKAKRIACAAVALAFASQDLASAKSLVSE